MTFEVAADKQKATPDPEKLRTVARGLQSLAAEIEALCDESLAAGRLIQRAWPDEGE